MDENEITVLLVEDDAADARMIERTLAQSERIKFGLIHVVTEPSSRLPSAPQSNLSNTTLRRTSTYLQVEQSLLIR